MYVDNSVLHLSKHLNYALMKLQAAAASCCTRIQTRSSSISKPRTSTRTWLRALEFRKDHLLYGVENKEVLGKMKDECAARPIAEYS